MSPILVQRATRHKDGWKMRFGCDTLIVTVEIETERLHDALIAGAAVANPFFVAMDNFNLEQKAVG